MFTMYTRCNKKSIHQKYSLSSSRVKKIHYQSGLQTTTTRTPTTTTTTTATATATAMTTTTLKARSAILALKKR